ncbi:hypothetical protein CR970_00715 [Candidatus Saccharibacteria bacterium]|nr:MAG: hypothetical protein CR970_00715 [Candidatus Saccharibacteria bacterium]
MVLTADLLTYYSSIPISRLESEVAHMFAAARTIEHGRSGAVQHAPQYAGRVDAVVVSRPFAQQGVSRIQEGLYYEDMPLRHRGRMIRDAATLVADQPTDAFRI